MTNDRCVDHVSVAALVADMHRHIEAEIPSPPMEMKMRQGLALAEEAGEAVGALRRYLGLARRCGTREELAAELADVIFTVYSIAHYTGIDINDAVTNKAETIFARGWKDVSSLNGSPPSADRRS